MGQAGRNMEDGAVDRLLVVGDRDGVVISCVLQVVHTFPASLRGRSRWWILRGILDALCDWHPALLPWKNGLPVLTSDCCLETRKGDEESKSVMISWPHP